METAAAAVGGGGGGGGGTHVGEPWTDAGSDADRGERGRIAASRTYTTPAFPTATVHARRRTGETR